MDETNKNNGLCYSTYVEKVKTKDWTIERYALVHDNDEDKIYESLVNTIRWKKEFGILDRTDQDFPKEVFQIHYNVVYERDKEGRKLIFCYLKYLKSTETFR